jgi:predicted TIM-barrel fold metal-dependent hydrolase
MRGKIAVEEHVAIGEFTVPPLFRGSEIERRIGEVDGLRLGEMERHGVEVALLSLTSPGVQAVLEVRSAVELARMANDTLAEMVARHPDHYLGLAALPLQDPEAAAAELERCVRELGFRGAMVNGYTNLGDPDTALYYDDLRFEPFWEQAERLNVPVYLHPREPLPSQRRAYEGYPSLVTAAWGYGVETATHTIRLIVSGLFDRHPRLQVVLGHLGETLPFAIWRLEHVFGRHSPARPLQRPISQYLRENVFVSTSGHFSTRALIATILEMGVDRVLFAADYPYETIAEAAGWFDQAPINEADRSRIGRSNAERLFGIGPSGGGRERTAVAP